MSNSNQNYSYHATTSFSSSSFSSSSTSDPEGTTKRYTETMTSNNRDGTTIRRTNEETGKPTLQDETYYPAAGGRSVEGGGGVGPGRRIEDVTDEEQRTRDRVYEERMEDEYAKREGGA